ncbi:tetratricopeptide repeat protein [Ktedonospora formicarum]|uniref:HTH cro/C1-type domain-containing protein n=1 Tax=Ktedonospora formicarum TaxID=2778364 RepID=A0A8J3ICR2_9CHLR|nr:tetratricopeptide repeat protein [Ktedonospora formicarum]GHO50805.1 hypothetical protein KSX_89680 [Ktedonospora formicarum]
MEHRGKMEPQPRLKLTEARRARALSQQDVAERLGTTHVNVSRWERGITTPSPYFCRKLCRLFGKTSQELELVRASFPVTDANESPPEDHVVRADHVPTMPSTFPTREPDVQAAIDPVIPAASGAQLVGREEVLARIRNMVCTGHQGEMIALHGLPGIGKTSLAQALAHVHTIRARFCDGILWAALGPHPDMTGLLNRWGELLGLSATQLSSLDGNDARARALHNVIGTRSLLLIIDDVWRVEDVLALKVGGPHCAYVMTTRFPEIATSVSVDGVIHVDELGEQESMVLLQVLAPQVIEREPEKANELIQAVGGLPLALTLIGNYVRKQAESGQPRRITEALQRLESAKERLHLSVSTDADKAQAQPNRHSHQSLQSVIAMTDQQFDEPTRAAFYTLSILPSKPESFSEEVALAVTSCQVEVLDTLVDSGILESHGTNRYTLHQTIRDYAYDRLLVTSGADAAYHTLVTYVVSLLESQSNSYDILEQERAVIAIALKQADALNMQSELVRAVIAFVPYCQVRGYYAQAEQYLLRAEQVATRLNNQSVLTTIYLSMGQILQQQGKFNQAEAIFQQGIALARQFHDLEQVSAFLRDLGSIAWKVGNYAQAEAYLEEGLDIARKCNDKKLMGSLLKELGPVSSLRGKYSQAEAYFQEGLQIVLQLEDYEQTAVTLLMNLGVTAGQQGNHSKAAQYFREGLELARQIGHSQRISALLANLGASEMELGHYVQAEIYFQEGLTVARRIGHREWISILLLNLGQTAVVQRQLQLAENYLNEALTLARQIGRTQVIAKALYEYGNVQLEQQCLAKAQLAFGEMISIVPTEDQELNILARYGLARVAAIQGRMSEAYRLGTQCEQELEAMGHGSAVEVTLWLQSVMK